MKAIRNIDTQSVIAIDIETVRYKEKFEELSEDWQSAWEYKNKQDGEVPDTEKLSELWEKNASLYAEFSKVCSISLVYLSKGKLKCKQYTSDLEYLILQELAKDLNLFQKHIGGLRLAGHAARFFDYSFLCKRYIANRMDIPDVLDASALKPWEHSNLCTNELWRSFGTGAGSSLQALCTLLDVPTSKVDLVGDQVGKAYFDGELVRIADYCSLDTIATYNVLRRFAKESIFLESEVEFVNRGQILKPSDVSVVKEPLFEKIKNAGKIADTVGKELLEAAKTLTEDECMNLVLVLKACLGKKDSELTDKENKLFDAIWKK